MNENETEQAPSVRRGRRRVVRPDGTVTLGSIRVTVELSDAIRARAAEWGVGVQEAHARILSEALA